MLPIHLNNKVWSNYAWPEAGDEWSASWAGSEYLWWGSIFPRIQAFLPAQNVLEIAPGFGRCTNFLRHYAGHLTSVDLVAKCVDACRKRFEGVKNVEFHVNDGCSLPMVPDHSIDFIFTWDSLVHAERDAMKPYAHEFARVLKPDGIGFIHHSNLGAFRDEANGELIVKNPHSRGKTVSAMNFESDCKEAGLSCLSQELLAWGLNIEPVDSISLITPSPNATRPNIVEENLQFMLETGRCRSLAKLYQGVGKQTGIPGFFGSFSSLQGHDAPQR